MHNDNSVQKVMLTVILALVPGIAVSVAIFGVSVLIQLSLTITTALVVEYLMLKWRARPVTPFLLDASAILTAMLLALSLPQTAPWWIAVSGTVFAIAIAKHLYGGLGYNPFNPAMAGYAFLLISFPALMTRWPLPASLEHQPLTIAQTLSAIFGGKDTRLPIVDAISGATPMDHLKTQLRLDHSTSDILLNSDLYGALAGVGYQWVALAYLAGGLWLVYKRVISWHIPVAMILAIALLATIFNGINSSHYASPLFHIVAGATLFGAFFIATDPVTGATTPLGKILYGAGIGILVYVIRTWGGYPDSVAFAVLLMNITAPLIDKYTIPRVFGHERKRRS